MRRRVLSVVLACALLAAVGGAATQAAAAGTPPIKHVFIVMLENEGFDQTFGDRSPAPYLSQTLPAMGELVPNYYSVTHQSMANYVALISGQGSNPLTQADCQVYLDVFPGTIGADGQASGVGCVYPSAVKTIADQLSAAGLSWKGYMDDMGTNCRHPATLSPDPTQTAHKGDEYAARHNPFVYFHSLLDSGACARNDVPLDNLTADLGSASSTPTLSFIAPNLCDDGHDAPCVDGRPGGLVSADAFLRTWVPRILASPAYRSGGLLAILFDEAQFSDATACCSEPQFPNTPNNGGETLGRGGGRTGAVLLSPYIDPGTVDESFFNHFTMLRSLEDLFGLSHLGYAALGGVHTFDASEFTCYAPNPAARRGRLPAGSEIKVAVLGQGTAQRPMVELKLWHGGRVSLQASRKPRGRLRRVGRTVSAGPCQLLKLTLPFRHGRAVVTARAFGGSERRTIVF